eukprot:5290189-Lingulodinium_polyedra.AAC.1
MGDLSFLVEAFGSRLRVLQQSGVTLASPCPPAPRVECVGILANPQLSRNTIWPAKSNVRAVS